jgi:hypothetical protein
VEQLSATSEVLRVISSSPDELEPVFNVMLENAVKLCGAKFGNMFLYDGKLFHNAAFYNALQALLEWPVIGAGPAGGKARTRHQPQDRQGPWHRSTAVIADACR